MFSLLEHDETSRLDEAARFQAVEVDAAGDQAAAIVAAAPGHLVDAGGLLAVDRVIEVGHINYAPALQRTRGATEAMYLMMARVFDELGYRRYEWKCDALNAPSRAMPVAVMPSTIIPGFVLRVS